MNNPAFVALSFAFSGQQTEVPNFFLFVDHDSIAERF